MKNSKSYDFDNNVNLDKERSKIRFPFQQLGEVLAAANHNEGNYRHEETNFLVSDKTKEENVKHSIVCHVRSGVSAPLVSNMCKSRNKRERYKNDKD